MSLIDLTSGQLISQRISSQKELQSLVHRIKALKKQQESIDYEVRNTVKKTQSLEGVKRQHRQTLILNEIAKNKIEKYRQKCFAAVQESRSSQLKSNSMQSIIMARKEVGDKINEMSQQIQVEIWKSKVVDQEIKKAQHDKVLLNEQNSKSIILNKSQLRMKDIIGSRQQSSQVIIEQYKKNKRETDSLSKLEDTLLKNLHISQQHQNTAADRLEALYLLPTEQYNEKFQVKEKKVTKTQPQFIHPQESKDKIQVYSNTIFIINNALNKQIAITQKTNKFKKNKPLFTFGSNIGTNNQYVTKELTQESSIIDNQLQQNQNNEEQKQDQQYEQEQQEDQDKNSNEQKEKSQSDQQDKPQNLDEEQDN